MRIIVVLALFISLPSYAHLLGDCCGGGPGDAKVRSRFVAEEVSPDGELTARELSELVRDAHEVFEHHDQGLDTRYMTWWDWGLDILKRWPEKFDPENIRNLMLNGYRWFSAHRQSPEMANASANVAAMLVTSHALEIGGGLAMASIGVHQESHVVQAVLTTMGVAITVPGLDPLCIVLVGSYFKWPKTMNRWLTVPRLFVISATHAGLSVAGAPVPVWYLQAKAAEWAKRMFVHRLRTRGDGIKVRELSEEQAMFRVFDGAGEHVDLEFQLDDVIGVNLKALEFSSTRIHGQKLRENLAPFGTSIRDLVFDVIYGYPTSTYYIESNKENQTEGRYVRLKKGAFPFHAFRQAECESLLGDM